MFDKPFLASVHPSQQIEYEQISASTRHLTQMVLPILLLADKLRTVTKCFTAVLSATLGRPEVQPNQRKGGAPSPGQVYVYFLNQCFHKKNLETTMVM